ncbi:DUF2911 domain-containing protein [soil metagenome]
MKRLFNQVLLVAILAPVISCNNQDSDDKSKRPSPPATVSQKIPNGATITIDYSQPSVKGRTIGKDIEPMDGEVWRTGANEATVFETDKDLLFEEGKIPAGKYALFTVFNGGEATVIFNKTWEQWGAYKYDTAEDALRIKGKVSTANTPSEKMTFKIDPQGTVSLLWGNRKIEFTPLSG